MKEVLEGRIKELSEAKERFIAEYNALCGRLEEAKEVLAHWWKSQCEKQAVDQAEEKAEADKEDEDDAAG